MQICLNDESFRGLWKLILNEGRRVANNYILGILNCITVIRTSIRVHLVFTGCCAYIFDDRPLVMDKLHVVVSVLVRTCDRYKLHVYS